MFDSLSDRLERSFKILKGEGRITEINVAETLKEIRRALLDADVNYKIAKSFTDNVKQQALGQKILTSVKPSQMMRKPNMPRAAVMKSATSLASNIQTSSPKLQIHCSKSGIELH